MDTCLYLTNLTDKTMASYKKQLTHKLKTMSF